MKILTTILFISATAFLYSCAPSLKEQEEKRIADSIRVSDSLAMVQAEDERIANSNAKVQKSSNPFEIKLTQHGFYMMGKEYADAGDIDYSIEIEIVNKTGKNLITCNFNRKTGEKQRTIFGNEIEQIEEPSLYFRFDNGVLKQHGHHESINEEISIDKPWEPDTKRTLQCGAGRKYFNDDSISLKPIHFKYTPLECFYILPITVTDPTGYEFSGYLMKLDIKDDWVTYQKKLK
jgi:hypothetical protein